MIYYPIVIPTLCRYEHLRNCIESLSHCTGAGETELYVSLDYPPVEKYREGYEQIRKFLPTVTGFKNVIVLEQEKNLGPVENARALIQIVSLKYDAYIFTEDDNVFSPNFLLFINKGLEKFANDDRVATVSGYNFLELYNQDGHEVYFRPVSSAWGEGRWTNKEKALKNKMTRDYMISVLKSFKKSKKVFFTNVADLNLLVNMINRNVIWADVARCIINIIEGKYELAPAMSMVRNMGFDGSGEHCYDPKGRYAMQVIDARKNFEIGEANLPTTIKNRLLIMMCTMPAGVLRKAKYMLITIINYIRIRKALIN